MSLARRVALGVLALLVVLAVVAQVVLPRIAEDRVRDELRRVGAVSGVEVRAVPAIKLLWGQVDRLRARVDEGDATRDELGDLLAQTAEIDELRVTAPRLDVGGLSLADVRVAKDADRVRGAATVATDQLRALAPAGLDVTGVFADDGRLAFDATVDALGQRVSGRAVARASDGDVVVAPEGLLGGVASYTAFSDPRLRLDDVTAADAGPGRLRLSAAGRLDP